MKNKNIISFPRVLSKGNPYLRDFYKSINNKYKLLENYRPSFCWVLANRKKFSIVHFHWINLGREYYPKSLLRFLGQIIFLFLLKVLMRKKIIFTLHNLYPHDCKFFKTEKLQRKLFLKFSDLIFVHQKNMIYKIKEEFETNYLKIFYIKHGAYNYSFNKNITCGSKKTFSIANQKNIISLLFFGQIRRDKGVLELIQFFNDNNFQNIQLVIAGKPNSNSFKKEVREKISNNKDIVLLDRFIEDLEMIKLFYFADYSILPFNKVTTSGSLILSLSFGVPVITTKNNFSTEILNRSEYGFIYHNQGELGKIFSTLEKTKQGYKLDLAKKFKSDYNWSKIGGEVIEILDKNL